MYCKGLTISQQSIQAGNKGLVLLCRFFSFQYLFQSLLLYCYILLTLASNRLKATLLMNLRPHTERFFFKQRNDASQTNINPRNPFIRRSSVPACFTILEGGYKRPCVAPSIGSDIVCGSPLSPTYPFTQHDDVVLFKALQVDHSDNGDRCRASEIVHHHELFN